MGKIATEQTLSGVLDAVRNGITDSTGERMALALEAIAAANKRVKITVNMVGTNGEQVHDEHVVITNPQTGVVMHNIPYTGAPIEVEMIQGTLFSITGMRDNTGSTVFYDPTTETGIAQSDRTVTITYQVLDEASSLKALQAAVRNHPGVEVFPIGTIVTLPWTDESGTVFDWPFAVAHYKYVVTEADRDTGKLTWCMFLMATLSNNKEIPFDSPEVEVATESVADASLTYYGKNDSTYTLLELSAGDTIPYSDYEAVYHNEILDTSFGILNNGYNNYAHSAYRQYLNSDAGIGEWWTPQHIGDSAPSGLSNIQGLLHGFTENDRNALTAVGVKTACNGVTDGGRMDTVYDKVFLPSIGEMYGVPNVQDESDVWAGYWRDVVGMSAQTNSADSLRAIKAVNAKTTSYFCRLRTQGSGSSGVYVVDNGGKIATVGGVNGNAHAMSRYRCTPILAIC